MALKDYQQRNVAVLIGILAALPDAAYDHNDWGDPRDVEATPVCAVGHAMRQPDSFESEVIFDPGNFTSKEAWWNDAFGPNAYNEVFYGFAYRYPNGDRKSPENVTRGDAIAKLEAYLAEETA
jgi:hypothetical protein